MSVSFGRNTVYRYVIWNDGLVLIKDEFVDGRSAGVFVANKKPASFDSNGEVEWAPVEEGFSFEPEHVFIRVSERNHP